MRYLIVLCAFCLFPCLLSGQAEGKQMAFSHLTIEQGLSQNTILSIAQDSIGYLWFATQSGLNKYNGKSFKHYNKQFQNVTRPTFSRLGKVYVDKQNQLWIVSNIGELERYQPKTDDFLPVKTNFSVNNIFQDTQLNMYLGTYNDGIYKIDAATKDTLQLLKGNDSKITSYHFLEADDALYAATSNGVLKIKQDNSYQYLNVPVVNATHMSSLATNASNTVWLGTYGQGLYYKTQSENTFKKLSTLGNSILPEDLNIEALLVDSKDRIWIATYGNGLYILDLKLKTIQQFKAQKNNPFAVHYNDTLCLFEDSTGNIWLGTDGAGASYFDEHLVKFNLLTNKQLPSNVNVDVIRSITTEDGNNIWLGTSGHGLTYIDLKEGNHITYTTENSEISSNRIVSLAHINNELWIGHQDSGLEIRNNDGAYQSFLEIKNLTIWSILPNIKDEVWLATENSGVILFNKNKGILKQFNTSNSKLTSNNIRAVTKGNEQTLWLGSIDNGLFKLDLATNKISKVTQVNDGIKSLYYQNEILWIGTNGTGLKRLDLATQELKAYTKTDGLPNDVVYGILPDKDNNLWLSTNYGLCKFKLHSDKSVQVENYTNLNGLQGLEFNTGAYYKDKNGVLYFGGLEGVNWFKPNQITTNTIEPQTVITGVDVFNKPVDFSNPLRLEFNRNTVTFTFSGLHFSQPERNQYKYKLVNNDKDWIEAGNNNVAHYTNLPANNYEFQVYASNYEGIWDATAATYSFTVLKPWFSTNLAKLIYALIIGFIGYTIYAYLKFRWEVKTQLQLEHAETERLKKLDEFKTKLYTNISHEIRTPLTLISGPIEQQLEKPHLLEDDKQELRLVKHNADRLLNLANQMLDLSLVESGQLQLHIIQGDLSIVLEQLVAAFQFKAKDKHINFKSNIETVIEAYFDRDIVEKVASNLLTNAIKYTPLNGEIVVDAAKQNNSLVLSVINNYDNIKRKDLSKLFQRFYQEDEATEGVGVGLALVKELVNASKGSIIANNIDADKIQFTVTLPITKEAFDVSELIDESLKPKNNSNPTRGEIRISDDSIEHPLLLIVEDEQDIRSFIKSIFSENYRLLEAQNGDIGITLAKEMVPDIIISDIMMPVKDGIALCNDLKHNALTSHIPIILLTAKVGEEHEITGLQTGADAYITKPFNSKKLQTRVTQLIDNRKQLKQHYSNEFTISPELAVTSTETEFLKRLQDVLNAHITEPDFTSERFGELLAMSRTQLHRKLKAVIGQSTSEFIRIQRLKLAVKLLKQSDINVSEIAYQVGFNSPSYFTKCFKEHYGSTPNDFLKTL